MDNIYLIFFVFFLIFLVKVYERCTLKEGELLLQDIPIRRAVGPLSSVRKIGPELSKKIFAFFMSTDENETL